MGPVEAVSSVLGNYFNFDGVASRSEYWWWVLATIIADVTVSFVEVSLEVRYLSLILSLLIFLPSLAVIVRRLHDSAHSGWWFFISFVPIIGFIWFLILMLLPSNTTANPYLYQGFR